MSRTSTRTPAWATILLVWALGTACGGDSPTAPSALPVTWTISPTSVVMHEGDTVVFQITSSGPPQNQPVCMLESLYFFGEFELSGHLEVGAGPTIFDKPTRPVNGACTVTLVKAYRYGPMLFSVVENVYAPGGPEVQTDIQATIDLEP